MKLSIFAISDPAKISDMQEELDAFLIQNSKNPFMLSVFIKKEMESSLRKGSTPIVLVFMTEKKIISVVPLLVKKKFGIGFASLLFDPWFSPDFIIEKKYVETCMQFSLNFIFEHLQCQFETLDLPADSLNLPVLDKMCETNSISFSKKSDSWLDHCIIPVNGTWVDFLKSKNRNFKRRFKQLEQQLDNHGDWQVLLFENEDGEEEAFQQIMAIEEASWKQNWRNQNGNSVDDDLLNVWSGSVFAVRKYPDFKRSVWFLELNGKPIAYTLVLQYKGTAYTCKTSYNKEYRRFSPGIYLKNVAIRDLFDSGKIKMIDFMTNLPFHERWTSTRLSRVEFFLSKGYVPKLLELTVQQPATRKAMRCLLPKEISNFLGN